MYILKNALTSIVRNKGRNLLIGIIILVISCATAVTLAINNSSKSLIESYKNKYSIEATLGINRENMMNNFDSENKEESKGKMQDIFSTASNITIEDIENYGNSDYVKNYSYTMTVGINLEDIEQASMNVETSPESAMGNSGRKKDFSNITEGDFTLTGYSSLESMNEFIEGTYKITEGEVFSDFTSDSCIINSELATLNDIKVNDTIIVIDPLDDSKTYELTITGIYEEQEDDSLQMFTNSVNTIITNTNFVEKVKESNSDLTIKTSPTFTLTSSDIIEKFETELRAKGLSDSLAVQTNLDQVESSTKTISNVKTFAITFLIITLIIGTVVLLIINMINIRERKYEIGVLRTIGMKKSKVAFQFLAELLIVSFVFLLIGAGIGACISVPVSNHLLQNEITSSQEENQNIENNFGRRENMEPESKVAYKGTIQVQAFDSIDAVVDLKVLVELLVIGLAITLISCTSAIVSIERFSPLTILKERS